MGRKYFIGAAAIALSSVAMVTAQPATQSPANTPVRPASAPSLEDNAEQFLKEKRAVQAAAVAELRAAGINYGNVRSLVARYESMLKPNARAQKAGKGRELNEIFLSDVALELAALGFNASDLRDADMAERLFIAAANKRRAVASEADLTLLASAVVQGRIVDYAYENAQGPSAIYAVIEVTEASKGSIEPGTRIRVPLVSRRLGPELFERDSSEVLGEPGTSVKAFLSSSARRFRGPNGRVPDDDDIFVKIVDFEIL